MTHAAITDGARLRRGWRLRDVALAVLLLVMAVIAARAALGGQPAQAQSGPCSGGNCVMLIEVAGLQPTELTRERTPFLWSLAHPDESGDIVLPGRRNGFIWEAPRASMTTSPGAATVSLLTGGSPRETGVIGDRYLDQEGENRWQLHRTGRPAGSTPRSEIATLPRLVAGPGASPPNRAEVGWYIGDPDVAAAVRASSENLNPGSSFVPDGPAAVWGDQSLCPIPDEPWAEVAGPCPSRDAVTLFFAWERLVSSAAGRRVAFSYIHLAELGRTKQRGGDVDATLAEVDRAIGTFLTQLSNDDRERFLKTTIVLTGSHGYEPTPPERRVPHPDALSPDASGVVDPGIDPDGDPPVDPEVNPDGEVDPTRDLGDYVREFSTDDVTAELVPQGTVATVYVHGGSDEQRQEVRDEIREALIHPSQGPNGHPLCSGATGPCIDDVLYMSRSLKADGEPENTVEHEYPTWDLDHVDLSTGTRTGRSGDLLVIMGQDITSVQRENIEGISWAAGRAVTDPDIGKPITNPYPASFGGPRSRAIAVLVNGPNDVVRQFVPWEAPLPADLPGAPNRVERMPVTRGAATGDSRADSQNARFNWNAVAYALRGEGFPVEQANTGARAAEHRSVDLEGTEFQPRTVDIAPTIAALMGVGMPSANLRGSRVLREAFHDLRTVEKKEPPPSGAPRPTGPQGPVGEPARPSAPPPADAAAPRRDQGPAMQLMLAPTLVSSVSSSRRFTVRWSPSEAAAATVRSYELQGRRVSTRTGRPASPWLTVLHTRQTHARLAGRFGETYQLRVRALDAAGRAGEWRTSGRVIVPLNATTGFVRHSRGGWARSRSRSAFAGSLVRARARGASIALRMPARRMAIIAPTSPRGGAIRISVGRRSATIPLRSRRSAARRPVLVTPALRPGTTVRITALSRGTSIDGFAFAG